MSRRGGNRMSEDVKRYRIDASVFYDGGPFVIPMGTEVVVASKHDAAIRRAKAEGRLDGLKAAEIIINGCEGDFSFALFKLKQQMEIKGEWAGPITLPLDARAALQPERGEG